MGRAAHLMSDTIYVSSPASVDGGGVTYGDQSSLAASVEHKTSRVVGPDGVERKAMHYLACETEIELEDRVWLDIDDKTKAAEARRPIAVGSSVSRRDGYTIYQAWFS